MDLGHPEFLPRWTLAILILSLLIHLLCIALQLLHYAVGAIFHQPHPNHHQVPAALLLSTRPLQHAHRRQRVVVFIECRDGYYAHAPAYRVVERVPRRRRVDPGCSAVGPGHRRRGHLFSGCGRHLHRGHVSQEVLDDLRSAAHQMRMREMCVVAAVRALQRL